MSVLLLLAVAAIDQPATNPVDKRRPDRNPPTSEITEVKPEPKRASRRIIGCTNPIRSIVFDGVAAPKSVADVAQTYVGRPCSSELLVKLTEDLSDAYAKTNVALYTVAIPDQDFSDGVVRVMLVEGWIDNVQVGGDPAANPRVRKIADTLVGERPLRRSTLERRSALLNAIPGVSVESSFDNAEGDDSVTLLIEPKRKKWQAALGINNRGTRVLGETIVQAGVDAYSLAVDGDQVSASIYSSPELKYFRAFDAGYSLPIGINGLTAGISGGKLLTRSRDGNVRGKATFAVASLSYPLVRRSDLAIDLSASIDGINSDNALFGNVLTTERTRTARAVASMVRLRGKTSIRSAVILSHGLKALGARTGGTDNETGFKKINATADIEHKLSERWIARASLIGQYSRDRLPGSELLALGGPAIGRGFDTAFISADRAIGGTLELAFRPIARGRISDSEIYIFVDGARAKINARADGPSTSFGLSSAGSGLRLNLNDRMELGVEGGYTLGRPQFYGRNSRLSLYYGIQF